VAESEAESEALEPEDSSSEVPSVESKGRSSKAALALELIAVTVVVALAVVAVLIHRDISSNKDDETQRKLAISAADQQVLDLTTLDYQGIQAQLDRMRNRTTGDFKRQFEGILTTFAQVVVKDKITAKGTIAASGLETMSAKKATVLVASSADVASVSSKQSSKRTYRFKVTLALVGGKWLVAGMEFVA
jgi:Mce-associated membrane protein